jgi:hypothetical protein
LAWVNGFGQLVNSPVDFSFLIFLFLTSHPKTGFWHPSALTNMTLGFYIFFCDFTILFPISSFQFYFFSFSSSCFPMRPSEVWTTALLHHGEDRGTVVAGLGVGSG